MDPPSPATPPPATQQAPPPPTENEVAEYLLLLVETSGPEPKGESTHPEDFDLEEEQNPVPDESTAEVSRNTCP